MATPAFLKQIVLCALIGPTLLACTKSGAPSEPDPTSADGPVAINTAPVVEATGPIKTPNDVKCFSDALPTLAKSGGLTGYWEPADQGSDTSRNPGPQDISLWLIGEGGGMRLISDGMHEPGRGPGDCLMQIGFAYQASTASGDKTATFKFSEEYLKFALSSGATAEQAASAALQTGDLKLETADRLALNWAGSEEHTLLKRVPAEKAEKILADLQKKLTDRAAARTQFLSKWQGRKIELVKEINENLQEGSTKKVAANRRETPAEEIKAVETYESEEGSVSFPNPKSLRVLSAYEVMINETDRLPLTVTIDEKNQLIVIIHMADGGDIVRGFFIEDSDGIKLESHHMYTDGTDKKSTIHHRTTLLYKTTEP